MTGFFVNLLAFLFSFLDIFLYVSSQNDETIYDFEKNPVLISTGSKSTFGKACDGGCCSKSKNEKALGTQGWKQDKRIQMLCRVPEEGRIAQVDKPQWKRISMAVDTGACETVGDPNQIPCKVRETDASRRGACFASATGEAIPNLGEMTMPMYTREGSFRSMRIQAAPVTKPLASVLRIVQAGHVVVFDAEGSYIMNKESGEINMLREEEGNYMLDVWVPPMGNEASGFPRQP